MTWLSRLILSPRSRDVRRDLADCQQLHRTLMRGFQTVTGGDDGMGARAALGVLYRVEPAFPDGGVPILVQSGEPPDWAALPWDYLVRRGGQPAAETKTLDPLLDGLHRGQVLRFRLHANPTRKVDTKSLAHGQRRHGRRLPLRDGDAIIDWVRRKAMASGFWISEDHGRLALDVNASTAGRHLGRRIAAAMDASMAHRLRLDGVTIEGLLRVEDPTLLRRAIIVGIGPGKAYGCGLLSVGRIA